MKSNRNLVIALLAAIGSAACGTAGAQDLAPPADPSSTPAVDVPAAEPAEASAVAPVSDVVASAPAEPADEATDAGSADSPLLNGAYIAPMLSYVNPVSRSQLDNGFGGVVNGGYRQNFYAVEGGVIYDKMGGTGDPRYLGGSFNILLFPLKSLSGLYATVGVGSLEVQKYATRSGSFSVTTFDGGLGYLFPIQVGNYEFGIRTEARYRYAKREERLNGQRADLDVPRDFEDVVVNLGVQLPLGKKAPPPPPPPPAIVVPVQSACSDGQDNDGDGLVDFPADSGCSAADDADETDPCKKALPGEHITLAGCGTGDVIVLHGVNFEFDKSSLTANAKTILDNVVEELKAYPNIMVEIGGHTDGKGADDYNQKLSEQRAKSVGDYLVDAGIASVRVSMVGYGETQPIADNETDEGRELNRRVALKIVDSSPTSAAPVVETAPIPDNPASTTP